MTPEQYKEMREFRINVEGDHMRRYLESIWDYAFDAGYELGYENASKNSESGKESDEQRNQ